LQETQESDIDNYNEHWIERYGGGIII
jgi:hypothetical protein